MDPRDNFASPGFARRPLGAEFLARGASAGGNKANGLAEVWISPLRVRSAERAFLGRAGRLLPHADRRPRHHLSAAAVRFRGLIVKPDGSEAFETDARGAASTPRRSAPLPAASCEPAAARTSSREPVTVRLLVTRPEPDNAAHRHSPARALGHDVLARAAAPHRDGRRCRSRRGAVGRGAVDQRQWRPGRLRVASAACASCVALPVFAVGRRSAEAARAAGLRRCRLGRRRRRRDLARLVADASRAGDLRCFISPARTAPATSRPSSRRTALSVRTVVVYRAVKAASLSAAGAARRSPQGRSTACCISRAAAPRHSSIAPGLRASSTARWRSHITVSRRRWPSRWPPWAPRGLQSRPTPRRPRCWSRAVLVGWAKAHANEVRTFRKIHHVRRAHAYRHHGRRQHVGTARARFCPPSRPVSAPLPTLSKGQIAAARRPYYGIKCSRQPTNRGTGMPDDQIHPPARRRPRPASRAADRRR